MSEIKLETSWKPHLEPHLRSESMVKLKKFLQDQLQKKKIVFPKPSEYFFALNSTPLDQVRVVILGQDPYHGEGQAHGLCFSVRDGVALPPSLQNIYKEIKTDLGIEPLRTGDLTRWSRQGVLLLNSVLTVEKDKAASHQKQGWEEFTDQVIAVINERKENVVFILWGAYAQKKAAFVDRQKHFVIESVHPSPLSAHRGFMGSKPFSKANKYLESKGLKPIDWR